MIRLVAPTALLSFLLALPALVMPIETVADEDTALDGKALFLAAKCQTCHAVSSADIEAKTDNPKLLGPDLTGVTQRYEPDWLVQYIKKEIDLEGKRHKKTFKGTDDELAAVIAWLNTQIADESGP